MAGLRRTSVVVAVCAVRGRPWLATFPYADATAPMFRFGQRAGVPPIRLHDLRHTMATLAPQAGVHPKVVQEQLGHSAINVTMDVYSHVPQAVRRESASRIAALFGREE
jgi:integrase